jgi:two-component system, cell cycle sensor histidine kinase and response regulator CckA
VRKSEASSSRETILVVEDTDDVRRMICQILTQHGYKVLEAANGEEALKVYGANIHLVLTDVVMPQMNGRQLAEELRRINPATRLIFMSGYTDDPMIDRLEYVAVFLAKPFTSMALTRKVREVLDNPGDNLARRTR